MKNVNSSVIPVIDGVNGFFMNYVLQMTYKYKFLEEVELIFRCDNEQKFRNNK